MFGELANSGIDEAVGVSSWSQYDDNGAGSSSAAVCCGCLTAERLFWGFSLPLLVCFAATVPDVRQLRWRRWYPATLAMAILWLAVLAELMMGQAERVACLLRIPDDVMGLTVTAAGTDCEPAYGRRVL